MNQLYATKKDLQAVKNELLDKLASKDELKQAVEQITINTRDIKAMRNDIGLLNVDMGNVKSDLQTVKSDLQTVQSEMKAVRSDVKTVQSEMKIMKSDIGSMQITIINMKTDIAELETKKDATKKFTILVGMIEGIAKNINSFKTELAAQNHAFMRYDSQLAKHEERIIKLESSRN